MSLLIKEREQALKNRDSAQAKFNENVFMLLKIASIKSPSPDMETIKTVFRAVKSHSPETIIVHAGPFIWKYREVIKNKDETFFANTNFSDEITEFYKHNNEDNFSQNDVRKILTQLQSIWNSNLTGPEKQVIWSNSIGAITHYAQFLSCEKKLIEVKKSLAMLK